MANKANEVEFARKAMMRKLEELDDSDAGMAQKILEDLDKARMRITASRTSLMNETFKLLNEGLNKQG